jgi:tetratricopeptide (TPR) repeat protein
MNRWLPIVAASFCFTSLQADDRWHILSDGYAETIEAGKSSTGDMKTLKHYEGLRHFAKGRMLELKDRIPDALQSYQLANQLDGQATDLIRHILPLCFKLEQTASSLKLMRRSLALDPKQADLWMKYAQQLLELQRYNEASDAVKQAFTSVDMSAFPAFAADLHVVEACCLEARQQYPEAVKRYQQALEIVQDRNRYLEDPYSPNVEEMPIEEAKLLERLARAALAARQWELAMDSYKHAQALVPSASDRIQLNLAEVYLAAGKPEAASVHLQKTVATHPRADEAYRLYVSSLQQSGRGDEIIPTLEELHRQAPQHTAINLVLAEQYSHAKHYHEAELLYREIMTVEAAPFPDAIAGYYRLLMTQGKATEALVDFDQLLNQQARVRWARVAVQALLNDVGMLQKWLALPTISDVQPGTRLMFIRLCQQSELWGEAERLTRLHLISDTKPQETYLLLARSLLEQQKFNELITICQEAINHPNVQQPLVFHIEQAKAHARLKQAAPALHSLQTARELCAPGTTDEHKLLTTELYIKHLLGKHVACLQQVNQLMETPLAAGPWARQVRYIAAHAHEALSQHADALKQYDAILKVDPNDSEAQAAQARCLLFQNTDLKRAETTIRAAIELDLIDQHKKRRFSPTPVKLEPKAEYQATLGAILLRAGRVPEGTQALSELLARRLRPDPWVMLAVGDAYLMQHKNDEARQVWKQAVELLPLAGSMGTDLTGSLQARLKAVQSNIIPASATVPRQP